MIYDITNLVSVIVILVLIYKYRSVKKEAKEALNSLKRRNKCQEREIMLFRSSLIKIDFSQYRWDQDCAVSNEQTSSLRFISTTDPSVAIVIHAISDENGNCRLLP
jgi:hypothetical protein